MSEHLTVSRTVAASKLLVTPETDVYPTISAKEVRVKVISGEMALNIPYVTSDWQSDSPTQEFGFSSMTAGEVKVLQLQNPGSFRFECVNKSNANPFEVGIVFAGQDSRFRKPMIKRGMIKRTMNGITRRSA